MALKNKDIYCVKDCRQKFNHPEECKFFLQKRKMLTRICSVPFELFRFDTATLKQHYRLKQIFAIFSYVPFPPLSPFVSPESLITFATGS